MSLKYPTIHCIADMTKLTMKKEHTVYDGNGHSFTLPIYKCPLCLRSYTVLNQYRDLTQLTLNGKKYINVSPEGDTKRVSQRLNNPHIISQNSKCYVCYPQTPHVCSKCNHPLTKRMFFIDNKCLHALNAQYCPKCNIYYLSFSVYKTNASKWIVLNPEDLDAYANIKANKEQQYHLQQLQSKQLKQNKQKFETAKQVKKQSKQKATKQIEKIYQHDNSIRVKDFVVRRTTFKCMHHDHHLQNIDAKIDIIDKLGNIKHEIVSAGYCPNCNIFFLMESTYQKLKLKGTLVCRISDEKTYLNGTTSENGMRLAQESILMQYGYNVSQLEDLSTARSKKILAVLVDNDVLTKSEIISYLDFFINQRKHQSRFEKAIEKWESDKEFIEDYKNGSYKQYGVKGIYRKY